DHPREGAPFPTPPRRGSSTGSDHCSGAGNDEDVVYVQRSMDSLLYESGIQSRVLKEIGGKSLTVTLQVYGFAAFTAERYPTSIVEIGGLTPPIF
ncbi:hypothetical protein ACJH7A_07595, partial [Mycobacterium sp. SMC-17]